MGYSSSAEVPSRIDGEVKRIISSEDALVNRSHTELEMDISMPYICVAYKFEAEKDIQLALKKDFAIQMALDALMSPLNPKYQSWLDQKIITQLAGAEMRYYNRSCVFALLCSNA